MKKLVYLIIFFLYSTVMNAQLKDLVQYVNTLQGTDSNFGLSYGNTYPTTGMPYGMHMWSAQTGKMGMDLSICMLLIRFVLLANHINVVLG